MNDGFLYPNGVLKNRFGIRDAAKLDRLEGRVTRQRLAEIREFGRPSGDFDAAHLKALHRHVFQDIYEWAGKTRGERITIEGESFTPSPLLRKGESLFALGPHIEQGLQRLHEEIRGADYLRGLSREGFCVKAAAIFADINAIHSFREGNGRAQRIFMEQLARQAGRDLDFRGISRERMIQASVESQAGPSEMFRRMFEEITDPLRRASLRKATQFLSSQGFDWNDRYIATTTAGQRYGGQFVGAGGADFMMHDGERIFIGRVVDLDHVPGRGDRIEFTARSFPRDTDDSER